METLKKILAIAWDYLLVIFGAYTALRVLFILVVSVGETRPAYVVDWSIVWVFIALVVTFTLTGWELRRLIKGE